MDALTGGEAGADELTDVFRSDCPARTVLDHITGRWGVLILVALADGPMRFSELRGRVGGISEKMLSQNLRVLARDGLVERAVEPSAPPRVSYGLTATGREISAPLGVLVGVVRANVPAIVDAQRRHDARA